MGIPARISTERLLLRPVELTDEPAMLAVHTDPATNRHRPEGTPHGGRVSSDLRKWVEQWAEYGIGYWAIETRSDSELIGFGGLRRAEWSGESVLNLYYRLRPSAWNRGYASEMVGAAVNHANTHLAGTPVLIRTRPDNLAARRVAEKLGFEFRSEHGHGRHREWVYRLPTNKGPARSA
ncbi:RimJ/RimL family protein N-acetyltransferase [Actinopolyspora biskrensis]|uniref:RimJ/RimL family protein N-acetyltransferase n=1 Tax=Actinopolyspora biskrensis TaxID=1470178 RepID=A0A852Z052_9ACTN|nr:GNAT family N-acetyltransferase [Actinopolyspora biskrensis]NYH79600.1 RimJ/RimL family protein N-acetyltransferase [Actinopolyspora biskrensis]